MLVCAFLFSFKGYADNNITLNGNTIKLSFTDLKATSFKIYRAKGRFAAQEFMGEVSTKEFTDNGIGGQNPYSFYYFIKDNADNDLLTLSLDNQLFGSNIYIYSPDDDPTLIGNEANKIGEEMRYAQFGFERYALFFKKGDYMNVPRIHVGFYTHVAGFGKLPKDCKMNNFSTPGPLDPSEPEKPWWDACNSTCTFWRSIENLSVNFKNTDKPDDAGQSRFLWGVSQAAPMRRIHSTRVTEFDYLAGNASGGFTADCYFEKSAGSYSQQQWYTRNSHMEFGSEGFSAGGWNYAYQGVTFGPSVNIANHSDNWDVMVEQQDGVSIKDNHQWNNVSRVETTPVIREKPFIFFDDESNRYKVFKPALRHDSKGVSWSDDNMGDGVTIDLIDKFYIAKPGVSAKEINAQLKNGKHILLTPGIYEVEEPIRVENAGQIVLGIGYATLIPGQNNSDCALKVSDVEDVTIAGLMFDTKYSSESLLKVGKYTNEKDFSAKPTLLADLFFRVGGVFDKKVSVDQVLVIKSNNVIGDHFWIWRADHGTNVSWNDNPSKNGIVVKGKDVTIYGLFNEHFQEYQALWEGENGRLYFYQCETPYDPLNQNDYLSHVHKESGEQANGYSAYKVAKGVKHHYACMMGIYDVFIYTQGADIDIRNSIEIPTGEPDVKIHHACNTCISNQANCGFRYIVGDVCRSTYWANHTGDDAIAYRYQVVDFNGTMNKIPDFKVDAVADPEPEIKGADACLHLEFGLTSNETHHYMGCLQCHAQLENSTKEAHIYDSNDICTVCTYHKGSISPNGIHSIINPIVEVYPNPTPDLVHIHGITEDYQVAVYSLSGTKLMEYKNAKQISLSTLPKGIYIIKINTQSGKLGIKKIVKVCLP